MGNCHCGFVACRPRSENPVMSCVGSPPATRWSVGRPVMPNTSRALPDPSAGGFFPATVSDQPNRNSKSELLVGDQVDPIAICLFVTYVNPLPAPPDGSGIGGWSDTSTSR